MKFNNKKILIKKFIEETMKHYGYPIKCQCCPHIKTSQLICYVTLAFNGLSHALREASKKIEMKICVIINIFKYISDFACQCVSLPYLV